MNDASVRSGCTPIVKSAVKDASKDVEASRELNSADQCGAVYNGNWRDGRAYGAGTMRYVDGTDYQGNFVDGLPDGEGIANLRNGDRYEGQWHHGNFDGAGTLRHPNGSAYQGNFREGKKDGKGAHIGTDGKRLEGEYRAGELQYKGYAIKDDAAPTGTAIIGHSVQHGPVPFEKSWDALSDEEQRLVRLNYPALPATNEPPYPLKGPKHIF